MDRFTPDARLVFTELVGKVDEEIGLTGEDLARAYPGQHTADGRPIVNIEFDSEGTRKFGELTTQIAGTSDLLAIFLDDQELIAPGVNQPITRGVAFIEGRDFTFDRVTEIALLLEGGRLPVPIDLIQERHHRCHPRRRLPRQERRRWARRTRPRTRIHGCLLPDTRAGRGGRPRHLHGHPAVRIQDDAGNADPVRSCGGHPLDRHGGGREHPIFERMKEELRAGRTLLSAINIGFNRAWPAIRDGNVSTLITCAILFWFADTLGATIVQGFAITLAIGVLISMFTAITVSRTFLRLMAVTPIGRRLNIFVPSGSADLPRQQQAAQT